jgi:hypothetical protein
MSQRVSSLGTVLNYLFSGRSDSGLNFIRINNSSKIWVGQKTSIQLVILFQD